MRRLPPSTRVAVVTGGAALLAGVLLVGSSASAALPLKGETVMTSVTTTVPSTPGNAPSNDSAVSADGRFVAFTSASDNLDASKYHGVSQIFMRNVVTGTTTLISVAAVPTDSGDAPSVQPSISADGRYVAFASSANNLTVQTDAKVSRQIYIRDTVAGTTRKISIRAVGLGGGDEASDSPSISADGSLVAYQSAADDLVAGIVPTESQIYVGRNEADPKTRLASARNGTASGLADTGSTQPSISGDGSTVVFASAATNLTSTTSNKMSQIYARDITRNITQRLSYDLTDPDVAGNGASGNPVVSFDGSRVAYESTAKNLVPQSINFKQQIILFDRMSASNALVSFSAPNVSGTTGQVKNPAISGDGKFVAFASTPGNLTATADNGLEQVYLREIGAAKTSMVSVQQADPLQGGTDDSLEPALSSDGAYVSFTSSAPGLSIIPTVKGVSQTYLRAVGAVIPTTTATPSPTGGTTAPTGAPATTGGPSTGGPGTGQGGSGGSGSGGGHLASTGLSQTPIIAAGAIAMLLALIGGSILVGARTARRRRRATGAAIGSAAVSGTVDNASHSHDESPKPGSDG